VSDVTTSPAPSYSLKLRRYTTAVIAAAVPVALAAAVEIARSTWTPEVLVGVLLFAAAAICAELNPVPLDEAASRSVTLSVIFLLASQVLFGWEYAVIASIATMGISQAIERIDVRRAAFNTSVYALSTFLSALPGLLLGWDGATLTANDAGRLTLLVIVGGAVFLATNIILIAVVVALARSTSVRAMLDDYVRHAGPAFAIMCLIAALAAALWKVLPQLELLLAGPLFALALYQRYAYCSVVATRDAETDGLTLLRNHRAFQAGIAGALEAAGDGAVVALAILDIDDFKGINDQFGHPVGDEVLNSVAEALRDELGDDRCYRVGGEEFAVLMPGVGATEAARLLEQLHARLARTDCAHGSPITISAGIALYPDSAGSRDELLRVADSALYWAKDHGKGRTCVYTPNIVRVRSRQEVADEAARQARLRAAEALVRVVDAKDNYTAKHSQAVSDLVEGIARRLGLEESTIEQLRLAGLLHDLGKVAIPDSILQKREPLDAEETIVLREHPEIGFRLLEDAGVAPVHEWVRHHHEAWDGSGYPLGLAGDEIPLGSRIILVADAFHAMTSERPYRKGGSTSDALAELRRCSWTQFDARIVAALEEYLAEQVQDRAEAS
jgi:diguanylate cyclase (GGDEF)-like protein